VKKHALLIGVENYRDEMISRLRFARADATALAERLRERCGFDHVRVLADESGEDEPLLVNIVTALRDVAAELRQEDLFLFFFAGHGIEKDGHGYLLARDSLQAFPEHGSLSLELLRKTFERLSARKRIILLDACRNSPEAGRSDANNYLGDAISRDIVAAARTGVSSGTTILLSACRAGQRAYEWPAKGHGVFTYYLLEGIDDAAWERDILDFRRLANYTAEQVCRWTRNTSGLFGPQEPWYEEFGHGDTIVLAGRALGSETIRPQRVESSSGHAAAADGSASSENVATKGGRIRATSLGRSLVAWFMDDWQFLLTLVAYFFVTVLVLDVYGEMGIETGKEEVIGQGIMGFATFAAPFLGGVVYAVGRFLRGWKHEAALVVGVLAGFISTAIWVCALVYAAWYVLLALTAGMTFRIRGAEHGSG